MVRFCALCGRTDGRFIENLCLSCYFKREIDHASFNVKALVCPTCLRYRIKGKWFEPTSNSLKEVVEEIIENFVEAPAHHELSGTFAFKTQLGNRPSIREGINRFALSVIYKESELTLEEETTVLFELKFEKCPTCIRIKKEPKEAILQFRSFDGKIDVETRKKILYMIEQSARLKNISYKVEEKTTGFDVKFSSQGFARSIARKLKDLLNAEVRETFKLKSMRDGKKGVLSIALRLPSKAPSPPSTELVSEPSFRESIVTRKYMVISMLGSSIQLMDLETYDTLEVAFPSGIEPPGEGEEVEAAIRNGELLFFKRLSREVSFSS